MGSHEEIILDVLGWLPMKSLRRFNCVSKYWNTLISEPYFKTKLDCPLGSKPLHGRVYCCCDGLFFIGIWCKVEEDQSSILLLWNPSTRESVILPSQSEVPQEGYTYGLGYDSTSDDYKVLGIDRFDEVPDEILSLKSGIEETSGRMSNVDMSARELSLVFVHVAFHWIGWEQERSIVSFKISDEIYGEIPLPRLPYTLRRAERGVSVLEESLCVYHNDKINFDLWVMKDYGVEKSWMKWFT
ncbi:hypothetical protein BC332_06055 [Capsicum chinense]|nr:hypothetical protein BC332_06055 [Capsicum chinense]